VCKAACKEGKGGRTLSDTQSSLPHYFCVTEARESACVMLVLSLANVPAERKLHNAVIISYGQPKSYKNHNDV